MESSDEEMDEDTYLARNISACEMEDVDLEGDMNASDDEEYVQKRIMKKMEKKKERKEKGVKAEKHYVEVDTNVF